MTCRPPGIGKGIMGAMSDSTPKENKQDASRLIVAGVVACFVLSGFAALLYQTAWMRQFSLVFGTSELAVAAVLSAYMGGLALGAIVAARFVHRITRPVLFYGIRRPPYRRFRIFQYQSLNLSPGRQ